MNITDIREVKANPNIPELAPGDTVRVRQKVVEGEKTRIQVFQGVVIRIHRAAVGTNFTVRRVSYGVGVERTFPIFSPMIDGVEVVRHGKVRRAKLYYLRGLSSRASRIKEKRVEKLGEEVRPPEPGVPEADLIVETGASTVATETSKTEAPTDEAPVAETPKLETPKTEAPKAETPKTEEQAK
jgi:large subunit ribosomal protein L19